MITTNPLFRTTCVVGATICGLTVMNGGDSHAGASTAEVQARTEFIHANVKTSGSSRSSSSRTRRPKRAKIDFAPVSTVDDPYGNEQVRPVNDGLEKINRGIFAFNHQLYRFIMKPIAKATLFVFREKGVEALGNVFENAEAPVRIVSSLLQGKVQRAGQETGKLIVNSSVGLGGLMKPSEKIESLKNVPSEDMGQTFGKWGVPAGPYLVLPVLGPSNLRDGVGKVGDTCLQPLTWVGGKEFRAWAKGTQTVAENPDRMDTYDAATSNALDPYISMREAYSSYRESAVHK